MKNLFFTFIVFLLLAACSDPQKEEEISKLTHRNTQLIQSIDTLKNKLHHVELQTDSLSRELDRLDLR
ncbi:MAG: hypothetical protein HUK21_04870 [Fibrobacteraceae bacterium]|nr:hypothetical protein [Fibrobacteraceae bacterium]